MSLIISKTRTRPLLPFLPTGLVPCSCGTSRMASVSCTSERHIQGIHTRWSTEVYIWIPEGQTPEHVRRPRIRRMVLEGCQCMADWALGAPQGPALIHGWFPPGPSIWPIQSPQSVRWELGPLHVNFLSMRQASAFMVSFSIQTMDTGTFALSIVSILLASVPSVPLSSSAYATIKIDSIYEALISTPRSLLPALRHVAKTFSAVPSNRPKVLWGVLRSWQDNLSREHHPVCWLENTDSCSWEGRRRTGYACNFSFCIPY